jgi:hypothetical protein
VALMINPHNQQGVMFRSTIVAQSPQPTGIYV